MALEGQADLEDTKAQEYDAYGTDEREDEVTQIVDYSEGIVSRKSGGSETEHKHDHGEYGEYAICALVGFIDIVLVVQGGSRSFFVL